MKLLLVVFTVVMFLIPANAQEQVYGSGVSLTEKTEISDILKTPEEYVGKTVLVEGKILDVCQHAGCWMEIEGSQPGEMIKVKVEDGVIVFPVEAKGNTALIEGEVYKLELDQEAAVKHFAHQAEDAGKEFDPSTVTGPVTFYQIKGQGTVINMEHKNIDEK